MTSASWPNLPIGLWSSWPPNNPNTCWLVSSLRLLSTNKLVCGGSSGTLWLLSHHPGGCCTLVGDEEIPPDNLEHIECLEKRYINVMNYHLDSSICLCTIPVYASMSMVPSHIFQSPMLFALLHPHTWQTFAFASVADESLDSLFGLRDWELEIHFFRKQVEMWTHLRTAHIFTVFLTIWDELWPKEPGSIAA